MTDRPQLHRRHIIDVIEQSVIVRGMSRLIRHIESAARGSRTMQAVGPLTAAWHALDRNARLRAAGTALIAAVVVHVGATWLHQLPVGWIWLVLPGIALVQGVVLLAAGSSSLRPQ